jgi:D-hydroxyproline dehydrogenase subunit gamma
VAEPITVTVDGEPVRVTPQTSIAAAVMMSPRAAARRSVTGELRGPLCGMGICLECRVTVDKQRHVRSCQTLCRDGMEVRTADA